MLLAALIGTAAFLLVLWLTPITVRIQVLKDPSGLPVVMVHFWPWQPPCLLTAADLDLSTLTQNLLQGDRKFPGLRRLGGWAKVGVRFFQAARPVANRFYARVDCWRWELALRTGSNDAARSAWRGGGTALWESLVGWNLATGMRLRTQPSLSVTPSFTENGLGVYLDALFIARSSALVLALFDLSMILGKVLIKVKKRTAA